MERECHSPHSHWGNMKGCVAWPQNRCKYVCFSLRAPDVRATDLRATITTNLCGSQSSGGVCGGSHVEIQVGGESYLNS